MKYFIRQSITLILASVGLLSSLQANQLPLGQIKVIGPIPSAKVITIGESAKIASPFQQAIDAAFVKSLQSTRQWSAINLDGDSGQYVFQLPLSTNRFTQGELVLTGLSDVKAYLNGQTVTSSDQGLTLELTNGDHQLIVIADVAKISQLSFDWQGANGHDVVNFYQQDSRRVSPQLLYDSEVVSQLSISPDGKQYLIGKKHYDPSLGDKANSPIKSLELRDVKSDKLLQRWTDSLPHSLQWSPNNRQLAFINNQKIFVLDRKTYSLKQLSSSLKGIGSLHWYSDEHLIFSWSKQADKGNGVTKRYRALQDRWGGWRNNSQLYQIALSSGIITQLTQGGSSTHLLDSKKGSLLLSRSIVNYKEPAHSLTEVSELNLAEHRLQVIGQYRTFNNAKYAKAGIYMVAGPSFENGLGSAVSQGVVANDYDSQLYYRDKQGQFRALSKQFDPSIGQIKVLPNDDLVMRVTERDGSSLFHFDISKQRYNKLDTGFEVVESFSVSHSNKPQILVKGTSATKPQQAIRTSLKGSNNILFDSKSASYANSMLGQFKEWNFENSRGEEISGRYYLPPNFDSAKKYPTLVYYYGGTSPVSRAFTGRYPFNLWAAQGYVVYVIQPTGATGFGQDFSGKHVNAWGKYTVDDIIEGTKAFTKAHSFVDANNIGNLGASYGGFMTMLLATKTDIFAASLSHAGISNLSNYWGYGWWGYAYSGVASKGSFPWNNRELYVEQSPLYHADKINHPMLLIHGDSDTNVPVSESHSMYTALKLLGKDVELIEFKGQDHTINAREERLVWWNTTLAFFDMHLKQQPQWWEKLYSQE